MITVTQVFTADNSDALAGTQLDNINEPGIFNVIAASTQNDTEITISMAKETIINAQRLPLRSSGVPQRADDPEYNIANRLSGRPVILVNIVTAATVFVTTSFASLPELG